MKAEELFERIRDFSARDAVSQVFEKGYSDNHTGADSAIFGAMELLADCQKALEAIRQAEAAAREEEREKNCKAICVRCRDDYELIEPKSEGSAWGHKAPLMRGDWLRVACEASAIRARKTPAAETAGAEDRP